MNNIKGQIIENSKSADPGLSESKYLYYRGHKEIPGLNILKLICAIFIVQIHFPSSIKEYIIPLTRIAVPIFFMITGYFLLDEKGDISYPRMKRLFKKILKIEIVACMIYVLYYTMTCAIHNEIYISRYAEIKNFLRLTVSGTLPALHLWYLTSLLQALVLLYIAGKFKINKWLLLFIPLGLIINLSFGRYNFLFSDIGVPNHLILSRNVFTIAIPCLLIGMLTRYYEHKLTPGNKMLPAMGIGLICIYLEEMLLVPLHGDITIFTLPCAIAVFIIFLKLEVKSTFGKRLAYYGRTYSLDIYVWHALVGGIIMAILLRINLTSIAALCVVVFTWLTAILLKRIGLKRLYS